MSTEPTWESVDNYTADLLDLVRDEGHPSADYEWEEFTRCLHAAADTDGRVDPNRLRELVRGVVAPRRVGAFTNRALKAGLIEPVGWVISTDTEGRNAGRPCRVYRLGEAA